MAKYVSGDLTTRKITVNTFSREFELSWSKNNTFFSDKVEIDLSRRLKSVWLLSPDNGPVQASPDGKLERMSSSLFGGKSFEVSCTLLNGKKFILEVNEDEYYKLCKYVEINTGENPVGLCEAPNSTRQPETAPRKPTQTDETDIIATIRRLGDLKNEGLLTEEEFESKKAELLKRL